MCFSSKLLNSAWVNQQLKKKCKCWDSWESPERKSIRQRPSAARSSTKDQIPCPDGSLKLLWEIAAEMASGAQSCPVQVTAAAGFDATPLICRRIHRGPRGTDCLHGKAMYQFRTLKLIGFVARGGGGITHNVGCSSMLRG